VDVPTYLEQIVVPTIGEFEQRPSSRRHAFLACVVTYHTVDYIAYPKKKGNILKAFRKESAAFSIVDRVANTFKHVKSGHENDMHNRPLPVEHVYSRPPTMMGVAQCGLSLCGDVTGGVALWGEDNADLLATVKKAVEFLRTKRSVASAKRGME